MLIISIKSKLPNKHIHKMKDKRSFTGAYCLWCLLLMVSVKSKSSNKRVHRVKDEGSFTHIYRINQVKVTQLTCAFRVKSKSKYKEWLRWNVTKTCSHCDANHLASMFTKWILLHICSNQCVHVYTTKIGTNSKE